MEVRKAFVYYQLYILRTTLTSTKPSQENNNTAQQNMYKHLIHSFFLFDYAKVEIISNKQNKMKVFYL